MKQITITLYVEPFSLLLLMQHLSILENLPMDNDYTFQVRDIEFSEFHQTGYLIINVPIDLWAKFTYKHKHLKLKV